MLRYLQVQNLAILENIEVTFDEGFTVLTGETGAGKSLIMDAIHLLLGERASADVIRSNQTASHIKALFSPVPRGILEVMDDENIDEILIERSIYKDKPNMIKINGSITSLNTLKELAPFLADMHAQADTRSVLTPAYYPFLLDGMESNLEALRKEYNQALSAYHQGLEELAAFNRQLEKTTQEEAFIRFQYEELSEFNPTVADEAVLKESLLGLENFDQVFEQLQLIQEGFERPSLADLSSLQRFFFKLSEKNPAYQELSQRYESAMIELGDIADSISHAFQALNFDPQELEVKQTRIAGYERLKRKHHTDTQGLMTLKESMQQALMSIEDQDSARLDLEKKIKALETSLEAVAHQLSAGRAHVASKLMPVVKSLLESVSLPHTQFEIVFEPGKLESYQFNTPAPIEFLISTNPGEPLKPMHKIASGGELSRIMLAIKGAFLNAPQIATLIVDEIDTGVSGKVASQMGALLRKISGEVQVIAITHLPQVAAKATHHFKVYKTIEEGRTIARLESLSETGRIEHLAEMLSDGRLTEDQRASARALLQ
jgi:DNA repair protein RecN (Recombination protein N)